MNTYHTILFDLDGTLTDPEVGIASSVMYAMEKMGRPLPPNIDLKWVIGPPLRNSFISLLQDDDPALVEKAVSSFREYFGVTGLFENKLYDGIPELLAALCEQNKRCYVATSKPTVYAERIITHFNLAPYFVRVYGSQHDGHNAKKGDLIRHVLHTEGLQAETTMMIGDRKYDINGAKENGVWTTAVTYGYGSIEEINNAQPAFIANSPSDIRTLLTQSG